MLNKLYAFLFEKQNAGRYWRFREKALRAKSKIGKAYYRHRVYRMESKLHAFIPLSAKIEGMPIFPHGLNGIFISGGAKIGKECVIFHQVTIGSNTLDGSNVGSPTIGDHVYMGAGAKIIGNVRVGNNVRIGANCVVFEDVPDNATVVLPAPRVIVHTEERDNAFIMYK